MVEVSNKHKSITVGVSSNNGNTIVTAKSDTSQYWASQSHTFADQAKESVQDAKHYANLANSYVEGFEDIVNSNTNDIITTSNNSINQITETANESILSVENKADEALTLVNDSITQINTTKNTAVDDINATKTNILKDIEFVAEGEKEEIQELAEEAKADIESTGFYMRDDKLYFINSKGEEEEFKSGGSGFNLFDTKLSDHVLTGDEALGWALQGTYVYKEALAGSRYGYPDFYAKCLEEYNNAENYLFESFKQPLLTSDGTLGGDSFAVYTSSIYNDDNTYSAYKAFDGDNSTCWFCKNTPADLIFYNPIALKVSSLVLKNRPSGDNFHFTGGKVYGSNDNLDYIELARFTNTISTAGASYTIDVNSDSFYKYYKIAFETSSKAGCGLANISINAVEKPIFVKNSNGHIFYNIADKDIVDNYFNNMGSAWFYGIDTENERVFLPRNNYFEQVTVNTTEVGKSIEAGLPTHTHTFTRPCGDQSYANGGGNTWWGATNGITVTTSTPNNSIYGKSNTVQPNAVKKLLYICVGNTTNYEGMTEVVNQGMEILEQVNQGITEGIESRVKLDGSNAEFPYIIDRYVSGFSWYRVWSDGFCEQGGRTSSVAGGNYVTVTLLKPYVNAYYTISLSSWGTYTASGEANDSITGRTTNSFNIHSGYIANQNKSWRTAGFVDLGG